MKTKANFSNVIEELAKTAIESAEATCAFLGLDDRPRDLFPLPSAGERDRWLAFWSDDTLAWEAAIEQVLGRPLVVNSSVNAQMFITESFASIRRFFDRDDRHFDMFFRSLEVRFVLRVFLPCLAKTFRRPSAILRSIASNDDCELLEKIVQLDPTVVHHTELATILNPPNSVTRRERWELMQAALARPTDGIEPRQVKYGSGVSSEEVASLRERWRLQPAHVVKGQCTRW